MSLPPNIGVDSDNDGRTIDEVIAADAAASARTAAAQGGVLVDMDMIVTPRHFARFFNVSGDASKDAAFAGSGLVDEGERRCCCGSNEDLAWCGRCPALTPLLHLIPTSRALSTADHVRSLDD